MMENEVRDNPVSYTKTLWAFACLGGAVPFWLAMLWNVLLKNKVADYAVADVFSNFVFSLWVFPAAWATALWAKRRNWRRNFSGCLKTVCAGGVCGGV